MLNRRTMHWIEYVALELAGAIQRFTRNSFWLLHYWFFCTLSQMQGAVLRLWQRRVAFYWSLRAPVECVIWTLHEAIWWLHRRSGLFKPFYFLRYLLRKYVLHRA